MKSLWVRWLILMIGCGMMFGFAVSTPEFIDISYPGSLDTKLVDINNRGQIVGFFDNSNGFLYEKEAFAQLDYPGAMSTRPFAINDHGQVVGIFTNTSGTHGFTCQGNVYSPIDVPGASNTQAYGINNRGQITGDCIIDDMPYSWVLDKGGYLMLTIPGSSATYAKGVNDRGQVVGTYHVDGELTGGFVYDRERYSLVNEVAGAVPRFWDINARGQIIGQIWGPASGFVLYKEEVTLLQYPGSEVTFGRGINDQGQVVGFYRVGSEYHGYLRK